MPQLPCARSVNLGVEQGAIGGTAEDTVAPDRCAVAEGPYPRSRGLFKFRKSLAVMEACMKLFFPRCFLLLPADSSSCGQRWYLQHRHVPRGSLSFPTHRVNIDSRASFLKKQRFVATVAQKRMFVASFGTLQWH